MSAIEQVSGYWKEFFEDQMSQAYMQQLSQFLREQKQDGQRIFPTSENMFKAFELTPLESVKVVIVGQDPYHGEGQAHGLSFSVQPGVDKPPSLKNIFKELNRDLGMDIPQTGCLQAWAERGVMLLNSVLTVPEGQAGGHQKKGWEQFTNAALSAINDRTQNVVFLSWGKFAHGVCEHIDTQRHCVIKTSHPSPLGATKAGKDFVSFNGSGCFSAANRWLMERQIAPVDWRLESD
ncbi:uracil-DNA glycosylase [Echinimonas agarilytica]|uniref:Uracil-DNA glycosylase n=1 Tax=Echinimonas agarilytica TaxID=1215918 RepID=A0AA41WBW2_9GAMM|nr:uracil-DNA glycosylase [Echinimonas agarilytica]